MKIPSVTRDTYIPPKIEMAEKEKIEEIIKEALEVPCILCKDIKTFTLSEIELLSEYAKENNIVLSIRAERSNFHQGTLIQLLRKDILNQLIEYM